MVVNQGLTCPKILYSSCGLGVSEFGQIKFFEFFDEPHG